MILVLISFEVRYLQKHTYVLYWKYEIALLLVILIVQRKIQTLASTSTWWLAAKYWEERTSSQELLYLSEHFEKYCFKRQIRLWFLFFINSSSYLKTFFKNVSRFLVKILEKSLWSCFLSDSVAFSLKSNFVAVIFQVNCVNRQLFLSKLFGNVGWSNADVVLLY